MSRDHEFLGAREAVKTRTRRRRCDTCRSPIDLAVVVVGRDALRQVLHHVNLARGIGLDQGQAVVLGVTGRRYRPALLQGLTELSCGGVVEPAGVSGVAQLRSHQGFLTVAQGRERGVIGQRRDADRATHPQSRRLHQGRQIAAQVALSQLTQARRDFGAVGDGGGLSRGHHLNGLSINAVKVARARIDGLAGRNTQSTSHCEITAQSHLTHRAQRSRSTRPGQCRCGRTIHEHGACRDRAARVHVHVVMRRHRDRGVAARRRHRGATEQGHAAPSIHHDGSTIPIGEHASRADDGARSLHADVTARLGGPNHRTHVSGQAVGLSAIRDITAMTSAAADVDAHRGVGHQHAADQCLLAHRDVKGRPVQP